MEWTRFDQDATTENNYVLELEKKVRSIVTAQKHDPKHELSPADIRIQIHELFGVDEFWKAVEEGRGLPLDVRKVLLQNKNSLHPLEPDLEDEDSTHSQLMYAFVENTDRASCATKV